MAHHKSAKKRIQLAEQNRLRNRFYKAQMRTVLRKVREATTKEDGQKALTKAYSVLDKLVSKGIMRKNTAANKKSGLTRMVNSLS
ncbi:MAG TPA: 30S ribosomal protein S20 [Calditrichia bacterium]|nr:30S ribosomal protein S20 [Calditrichota bacterium]HQU71042.1 30S ribosomal protein S20 [Calditrichia bacterium]HQV33626.1 30S ribosomal protein S20 [Calditrichia bacterium]